MTDSLPFKMLFLRLALFAIFQSLIALVFVFLGKPDPWYQSQGWWIMNGLLTNIVTFIVMRSLYRKEGIGYFDKLKFIRKDWWKDMVILIGVLAITVPISMFPNTIIANWLYGSTDETLQLFFRLLPYWLIMLGFVWSVTQGLVELPFYFAYIMPRLEKKLNNGWTAWALASFFLALQHITMPLIFDLKFIIWRFGMFLLFAFFIGLCLKLRPRLFPYVMIMHALMDMGAVAMLFTVK